MADKIKLSKSEEMYLVTIRMFCEHCDSEVIPIPVIAEELEIQPVSVNQMIKKLADSGFVIYTPYKGVALTPLGQVISTKILRHRRLWEVFLVKNLSIDLDDADELACQLEHITSEDLAERLSNFLGDPTICFHGDPIYKSEAQIEINPLYSLTEMKVGQPFHIVRIDGDSILQDFLSDVGVYSGNQGLIIGVDGSGNLLLETGLDSKLTITREVADQIMVKEQYV